MILSRDISRTKYTEGFFFLVCFCFILMFFSGSPFKASRKTTSSFNGNRIKTNGEHQWKSQVFSWGSKSFVWTNYGSLIAEQMREREPCINGHVRLSGLAFFF